jgi:hypothetical protein
MRSRRKAKSGVATEMQSGWTSWPIQKIYFQNLAFFLSQESANVLTTTTTHLTTISPSKNHVQRRTFPKTPSKNARKPENGSTGASDIFCGTHRRIFTAGTSKPAHSTDTGKGKGSSPAEAEEDSAAASAAAAHQPPADSIPPEIPS